MDHIILSVQWEPSNTRNRNHLMQSNGRDEETARLCVYTCNRRRFGSIFLRESESRCAATKDSLRCGPDDLVTAQVSISVERTVAAHVHRCGRWRFLEVRSFWLKGARILRSRFKRSSLLLKHINSPSKTLAFLLCLPFLFLSSEPPCVLLLPLWRDASAWSCRRPSSSMTATVAEPPPPNISYLVVSTDLHHPPPSPGLLTLLSPHRHLWPPTPTSLDTWTSSEPNPNLTSPDLTWSTNNKAKINGLKLEYFKARQESALILLSYIRGRKLCHVLPCQD